MVVMAVPCTNCIPLASPFLCEAHSVPVALDFSVCPRHDTIISFHKDSIPDTSSVSVAMRDNADIFKFFALSSQASCSQSTWGCLKIEVEWETCSLKVETLVFFSKTF